MKKYFNLSALLLVVFVLTSYGKNLYVSANGKYTNLVYNIDLSWLYSDNRTITDLQSEELKDTKEELNKLRRIGKDTEDDKKLKQYL